MSLFQLLADFVQPYIDLLPRIEQRPASNEWLVIDCVWHAPRCTRLPTIYVPTLTHVERYPSAELPIDTGLQSLTTADGHPVTVNATAIIIVDDPVVLREHVPYQHWEEWVAMVIRGAVEEVTSSHNFTHLQGDSNFIIRKILDDKLSQAGVYLERLVLEDFTLATPIRLFGHLPSE